MLTERERADYFRAINSLKMDTVSKSTLVSYEKTMIASVLIGIFAGRSVVSHEP